MTNCPECGLNLGLVGRRHVCRPRVEAVPHSPEAPVTNKPVTNRVTNKGVARVTAWRAANPDRYRDYQRVYMAKRRAHNRRA